MQIDLSTVFEVLNVKDLNNLENLNLLKQDLSILQNANIAAMAPYLPRFTELTIALDNAIAKQKRSSKTAVLATKDRYRDDMAQGVRLKIMLGLYHWNPEVREAAKRAKVIYDTYQKDLAKNYRKESEAIVNLLQDMGDPTAHLSMPAGGTTGGTGGSMTGGTGGGSMGGSVTPGTYSADVTTLELNEWLDHLRAANNDFVATYESREADRADALLLKEVTKARQDANNFLRMLLNMLMMLIETNGMAQYEHVVAQLNVVFHEWNVTLNVRKGKAHKEDEENEGEGSEEGNETPTNTNEGGSENTGEENGGENGSENTNTDNGGFGDESTPSANA